MPGIVTSLLFSCAPAPVAIEAESNSSTLQPPACGSGTVGDPEFCTHNCPCSIGQGDCDDNGQCSGSLACVRGNGPKFGFAMDVDVCAPHHCKNKVIDGDELGVDCGGECGVCVPECQNAILDPGEQCDDGNRRNGDGCENDCTIPRCGNGIRDPGEHCDDGNFNNGDTCERNCTKPRCGNGILDDGELCDDGNRASGDSCASDCSGPATCGNEFLDPGEECEDDFGPDPADDGDGCSASCQIEYAIDVTVTVGDSGDAGVGTGASVSICPLFRTPDLCIQAFCAENTVCHYLVPLHSDVVVRSSIPGPTWEWSGAGCELPAFCSCYFGDPSEVECGAFDITVAGSISFHPDWIDNPCAHELGCDCGNGVIDGPELCDDGNLIDGDGCSDSCAIEEGF